MPLSNSIIIPGVGYGFLKFGMHVQDVVNLLGKPKETEHPDEDGNIIYEYKGIGINYLRFSHEEDFRLVTIELNKNSNASLWDEKIFDLPFEQIEVLCKARGYLLNFEWEIDDNEIYEILYSVSPMHFDFYFDRVQRLIEFSFGVIFNEEDLIVWPE